MKPSTQCKLQLHLQRGNDSKAKKKEWKWQREREKVMKRAHCFQSARMSLSFRPSWIPAIQMTGVRRPGLQRVSPSPSQQLPFMRLRWLWGHLHHNSCHLSPPPPPSLPWIKHTYTCTHTKLLQLNANGENQKGIRDGCCLRTPMCGFVWMGPKGGEVSDTTGCWRGWRIAWPARVCHDARRVERVTNPRFATRATPWHSTRACCTTVTWVGQVTFELSPMCPLCHWILYQFHTSTQYGSHWVPIQSLVFRLDTKHSGYSLN